MGSFKLCFSVLGAVIFWSIGSGAEAACPTWPTAERFQYVEGGAEVKDTRTGLIWSRCSVGQTWSGGSCVGNHASINYEAALAHAAGLKGWRLPNIRELSSLADKGCKSPAIDAVAFPSTLQTLYWSSTPDIGSSYFRRGIGFELGTTENGYHLWTLPVRLVRLGE